MIFTVYIMQDDFVMIVNATKVALSIHACISAPVVN